MTPKQVGEFAGKACEYYACVRHLHMRGMFDVAEETAEYLINEELSIEAVRGHLKIPDNDPFFSSVVGAYIARKGL